MSNATFFSIYYTLIKEHVSKLLIANVDYGQLFDFRVITKIKAPAT